jgi:branched-chain amino acid transport system permease protein
MELFIITLVSGISVGSIYGLIALTFTSIYNVSGVLNFSQGEFVMLGALGTFLFTKIFGLPFVVSLLFTVFLVSIVGVTLQKFMVAPLVIRGAAPSALILGTLAAGQIISGSVGIATNFEWVKIDPLLGSVPWRLLGIGIMPQSIIIILVTGLLVVAYWFFLKKTIAGRALRAVGCDSSMASLLAIRSSKMLRLAFIVSASMAAIAGILIAPVGFANATMGLDLVIKGFIASIFGGLGNPFAAVLGGLILGVLGALLSGYYSSAHAEIATFTILLLVLIPRPQGLFGQRV